MWRRGVSGANTRPDRASCRVDCASARRATHRSRDEAPTMSRPRDSSAANIKICRIVPSRRPCWRHATPSWPGSPRWLRQGSHGAESLLVEGFDLRCRGDAVDGFRRRVGCRDVERCHEEERGNCRARHVVNSPGYLGSPLSLAGLILNCVRVADAPRSPIERKRFKFLFCTQVVSIFIDRVRISPTVSQRLNPSRRLCK